MTAILPQRSVLLRPPGCEGEGVELRPGERITVGRDASNRVQIAHHSVQPFHCELRLLSPADPAPGQEGPGSSVWSVWVRPLAGAVVRVDGALLDGVAQVPTSSRLEIGVVPFEFETRSVGRAGASSAREEFGERLLRALRSAPWVSISVIFHLTLVLLLEHLHTDRPVPRPRRVLVSDRVEIPEVLPETPTVQPDWVLEDPVEPDDPEVREVEIDDSAWTSPAPSLDPAVLAGRPRALGSGAGASGNGLGGGAVLDLGSNGLEGAGDLVHRLRSARAHGLELLFVVDTTSSMEPFLDNARRTLDLLVTELAAFVPDLRIGVVAFRDRNRDEAYLTRILPLTKDRYELLNFLEDLQAEGGGDLEEAVDEGLRVAFEDAGWRPGTYRSVVVVGDAGPHPEDWSRLRRSIDEFRRHAAPGHTRVSALYVGPEDRSGTEDRQALAQIADLGGGSYLALDARAQELERSLLTLTFGHEFETQIERLRCRLGADPRAALLERRIAAHDVEWLVQRLRSPPVHPRVVTALRELWDPEVDRRVRALLDDPSLPTPGRFAALYLLRKEAASRGSESLRAEEEELRLGRRRGGRRD